MVNAQMLVGNVRKVFAGHNGTTILRYAGVFVFFLVAALIFGRFSLTSPFIGDDLHLIRTYSAQELLGTWTGTWDPDGIENPGFRPFTTLFYHLQARTFGPSVVLHRVFLLGLFAILLTLVGMCMRSLYGVSYRVVLFGGFLGLLHTANVSHYSWITDGVYLLAGILVVASILSILRFIGGGGNFGHFCHCCSLQERC